MPLANITYLIFQGGKNDKIVKIWGLIIRIVRGIDVKCLLRGVLVSLATMLPLEIRNIEQERNL